MALKLIELRTHSFWNYFIHGNRGAPPPPLKGPEGILKVLKVLTRPYENSRETPSPHPPVLKNQVPLTKTMAPLPWVFGARPRMNYLRYHNVGDTSAHDLLKYSSSDIKR